MEGLDRDLLFIGLTRPPMLIGVTYGFAVVNAIVTVEAFLILKSFSVVIIALAVHGVGFIACLQDVRWFDVWLVKVQRCPRIKNFQYWHCNSYRA